ncbi:MAG: hypothetical protein MO847_01835 [Candidatus Protistobacter heckmanni]|nr:hypothetical protein [Candidatus Protistobacter heckmanni]
MSKENLISSEIEVVRKSAGGTPLADGAQIALNRPGSATDTLKDLSAKVGPLLDNLAKITGQLASGPHGVDQLLGSTQDALDKTNHILASLDNRINDRRIDASLTQVAASLEQIKNASVSIAQTVETSRGLVATVERELRPTLQELKPAVQELKPTLQEARGVLGEGALAVDELRRS